VGETGIWRRQAAASASKTWRSIGGEKYGGWAGGMA
jgi:hypothetical protein